MKSFVGEQAYRSNFYTCKVVWLGITFQNSESAFQSGKVFDHATRMKFVGLQGQEAKSLGRKVNMRRDWDDVKIAVMKAVVRAKFKQNKDIRKLLIESTDDIVEHNEHRDTFWGKCRGEGRNELGKILEEERAYWQSLQ